MVHTENEPSHEIWTQKCYCSDFLRLHSYLISVNYVLLARTMNINKFFTVEHFSGDWNVTNLCCIVFLIITVIIYSQSQNVDYDASLVMNEHNIWHQNMHFITVAANRERYTYRNIIDRFRNMKRYLFYIVKSRNRKIFGKRNTANGSSEEQALKTGVID